MSTDPACRRVGTTRRVYSHARGNGDPRCRLRIGPFDRAGLDFVMARSGASEPMVTCPGLLEAPGGTRRPRSPPRSAPSRREGGADVVPPQVPPPITRKHATKMIVELEVRELVKEIADGRPIHVLDVRRHRSRASFLRVYGPGIQVEFHLRNHPDNTMPHNIDLHAVTGPGGGATSSFTAPGHQLVFSFEALNPGCTSTTARRRRSACTSRTACTDSSWWSRKAGYAARGSRVLRHAGRLLHARAPTASRTCSPSAWRRRCDEDADYVLFNGSVGCADRRQRTGRRDG